MRSFPVRVPVPGANARTSRRLRLTLGSLWAATLFVTLPLMAAVLTPVQVARQATTVLDQCIKKLRCDVNACASNGGLDSCYSRAEGIVDANVARLDAALAKRDPWCARHWTELREKHAAFMQSAISSNSLADAPYNSDDDLRLLLARQEYEIGYRILANSACRARPARP